MDKTIAEIQSFWEGVGLYANGCPNKQVAKIREEFMEVLKSFYDFQYVDTSENNKDELERECGDLFISLMNFCEILGFDIELCAKLSHDKNSNRNYYMRGNECVRDK